MRIVLIHIVFHVILKFHIKTTRKLQTNKKGRHQGIYSLAKPF